MKNQDLNFNLDDLTLRPIISFEQRKRKREREYRKKIRKEKRKLKRSFGRYSSSFSFPPISPVLTSKNEKRLNREVGRERSGEGKKGVLLLVLNGTRIPVYLSMISLRFSIGTESGAVDFAPADIPVKSDKPQKAIC